MKFFKKIQIGIGVLIGIMVLLNVGMTYARYQSTRNAESTVGLASWKVKINNSDITKRAMQTFTVSPVILSDTNVKDGKVAPESRGYFDLAIDASLVETDYHYDIVLEMPSNNVDISLYGYAIGSSSSVGSASVVNASGVNLSGNLFLTDALHDHPVIRVYFEWNDATGSLNNYEDAEIGFTQSNFLITVTATVEQVYGGASSFSYELDGGVNASSNVDVCTVGMTYPLDIPSKPGFAFLGWYLDSEFTQGVTDAVCSLSNTTYYAKWAVSSVLLRDKVLSVQNLYTVGESSLSSSDIVVLNGRDYYVVEVNSNKAKMISREIYTQNFSTTSVDYANSNVRSFMDSYYATYLAGVPVVSTTITYYKGAFDNFDSLSNNIANYQDKKTLSAYVFAIDGVEARSRASLYNSNVSFSGVNGFWTTAVWKNRATNVWRPWTVFTTGQFDDNPFNDSRVGARPMFWVDLTASYYVNN